MFNAIYSQRKQNSQFDKQAIYCLVRFTISKLINLFICCLVLMFFLCFKALGKFLLDCILQFRSKISLVENVLNEIENLKIFELWGIKANSNV